MDSQIKEPESQTLPMVQILQKVMLISRTGFYKYNFTDKSYFVCKNLLTWFSKKEQDIIQENGLFALLPTREYEDIAKKIQNATEQKKKTIKLKAQFKLDEKGSCIFKINLDFSYCHSGEPLDILITLHDITKQETAKTTLLDEKALADKHAKFRANQIANMSHEIRTPIGGIIGMTDVLLNQNYDEQTTEKLEIIKQSAEIMMQTLTLTLDHCKIMANDINLIPIAVSPKQLLASTCLLWQGQAAKNNTKISYSCASDLPTMISIDEFRIKQCLNNLLSNSIKFTKNGQIKIVMQVKGGPQSKPELVLMVQDTGIGMTPEQQARVFEPFEQADADTEHKYGGTGLGMSIIQKIIKTMEGRIVIKSKKDIGTIVGLILPLKEADVTEAKAKGDSSNNVRIINEVGNKKGTETKEKTILIVDDISTNRLVLEYTLCDLFPNLVFAENGQEAIDILKTQPIDLVLMDIHMPIINGIDATKMIREANATYRDVPIYAVTADAEYHKRDSSLSIGFDGVLAKPINKKVLLETVDIGLSKPRSRCERREPLIA